MATIPTDTRILEELRFRLHGAVHEPGEPQYDDACALFNSMIEKRPRWVVACVTPDDVSATLAFARDLDLPVAVRGGGHSVAGLSLCDDGVVIDIRPMSAVEVDPERRVARVGGGATLAQMDAATQAHGLATTGGRVSTTGVAGLTMGGGTGWLERKYGLACDNLVAAELVIANGEVVRASAEVHPDLFWALKGGGGNYGVVTALEFRLHPVGPEVLAGLVLYPAEQGRDVMRFFRDLMIDAPDELSIGFGYLTGPDDESVPAELRGQPCACLVGMHCGPLEQAEEVLAPVRAFGPPAADLFQAMPYAAFQQAFDDPPGYRNYWTAANLPDLTEGAIEAIATRAEGLDSGPSQLFIPAWGGAIDRVEKDSTPLAARGTRFVVHPLLLWEDPDRDAHNLELGRGLRDDLEPYTTGSSYLNFLGDEGPQRVRDAYGSRDHDRLRAVKAVWDPDNVFHGAGNPVEA